MQVEPPHLRVAEDDGAAPVGLEPVLVRVDDDRVAPGDRPPGLGRESFDAVGARQQGEETAVGGVDMETDAVPVPQGERGVYRIDSSQAGGSGGEDDGAHVPGAQHLLQRVDVDTAPLVGGDRVPLHAEDVTHTAVRVVGLGAVGDAPAGVEFPGDEQGLEVGDRAAGGEVAEVRVVAEHRGELRDGLPLHRRGGGAAVQRVVVRVDQHGGEVADHGGGVRGLEHLARVARVEEGVVVLQSPGELLEDGGETVVVDVQGRMGLVGAEGVAPLLNRVVGSAEPVLQVHRCPFLGFPRRHAHPRISLTAQQLTAQ